MPSTVTTENNVTIELYFESMAQGQVGLVHIYGSDITHARASFLENEFDFSSPTRWLLWTKCAIGRVGSIGCSGGAHFHWEMAVNGEWVDSVEFTVLWMPLSNPPLSNTENP